MRWTTKSREKFEEAWENILAEPGFTYGGV
jgi:hypothetical protein